MKIKSLLKNNYFHAILLFILSILFVSPWGDHAINDDWDFFLHTKFFMQGDFEKFPQIDSAFVFQGIIGMVWSKIFGLSFVKLRILSIIFSFITLYGVYKIFKHFGANKKVILLALLTIIFNPIYFTSSLSYMTEIYFLAFAIWSVYYFLEYLNSNYKFEKLFLSVIFAGVSLLIRQFGVVLIIAYLMILAFISWKEKQVKYKDILCSILVFAVFGYTITFWPKYLDYKNAAIDVEPEQITQMFQLAPYLLAYFTLFVSPFIAGVIPKIRTKLLVLFGILSSPFAMFLYSKDIFPLGNVFYIEGLYTKTDFKHYLNLFDNIPFKVFLSIYISFMFVSTIYWLVKQIIPHLKKFNLRNISLSKLTLFINFLGMAGIVFASVFVAGDFYERYFFNAMIFLIIFIAVNTAKLSFPKLSFLAMFLLAVITVFLSREFYSSEKIRWEMGREVKSSQNLERNEVHVNGVFTRYDFYSKFNSPSEVYDISNKTIDYECYIGFYTDSENANILYRILNRFENSRTLNKFITNPQVYRNKTTAGIQLLEWHWDDVFYERSYFSPLYSILGVRPVLAAYCE